MKDCDVRDKCFATLGTPSEYLCRSCENQEHFEPLVPPSSVGEMIDRAIAEGVTHFHLFDMSKDFDDYPFGVEWHWDLYDHDPHVWFGIPKPWTLRLYWRGWRKGRLPFDVYVAKWMFTYYKNDTVQGCQCIGGPDIDPHRGLMYALSNYHCAVVSKFDECPGGCESDCPHRDSTFK